MADKSDVDLVAAILTPGDRVRPKDASEYSWGVVSAIVPTRAQARASAFAVVEALRGTGRLVGPARLAEFGRIVWAYGWIGGALVGGLGEQHNWPWLVTVSVGAATFVAGMCAVTWVAHHSAGQGGRRRG